jgi:DNA transformation protein
MTTRSEFVEFILEMMALFGSVEAKRMFGGYGLYLDGVMFALVADDVLYFKVDDHTRSAFEKQQSEVFTYHKNGTSCKMSYCSAPDDVLESQQAMYTWSQTAYDAALRAHQQKRRKQSKQDNDSGPAYRYEVANNALT